MPKHSTYTMVPAAAVIQCTIALHDIQNQYPPLLNKTVLQNNNSNLKCSFNIFFEFAPFIFSYVCMYVHDI